MALIYRKFSADESVFRTETEQGYATWLVRQQDILVTDVLNHDDNSPAYRWPDTAMPYFNRPGYVAFEVQQHPTLLEVRERMPSLTGLWDAVQAEYFQSVSAPLHPGGNPCAQGRMLNEDECAMIFGPK